MLLRVADSCDAVPAIMTADVGYFPEA